MVKINHNRKELGNSNQEIKGNKDINEHAESPTIEKDINKKNEFGSFIFYALFLVLILTVCWYIMKIQARVSELEYMLVAKNNLLQDQDNFLKAKDNLLQVKDSLLEEQKNILKEKDNLIEEHKNLLKKLTNINDEQNNLFKEKDSLIKEQKNLLKNKDKFIEEKDKLNIKLENFLKDKENLLQNKEKIIVDNENKLEEKDKHISQMKIDHKLDLKNSKEKIKKEHNEHIDQLNKSHKSEISKNEEDLKKCKSSNKSSSSTFDDIINKILQLKNCVGLYEIIIEIPKILSNPLSALTFLDKLYKIGNKCLG